MQRPAGGSLSLADDALPFRLRTASSNRRPAALHCVTLVTVTLGRRLRDPRGACRAGIFCIGSFGSALAWLALAPIADIAEARFDVGPGFINSIANLFMMVYIPGTAVTLWIVERCGPGGLRCCAVALCTALSAH